MGTTLLHIYIGYGMLVQYQMVIFSFVLLAFTLCVTSTTTSKVHQVQLKFWLIMANSASDHSFRHLLSVLVMTYSLTM